MSHDDERAETGLAALGLDPVDPAAELRESARACRARVYNEEGIPMILVLERVDDTRSGPGGGTAAGDRTLGPALARAFEVTLDALSSGPAAAPDASAVAAPSGQPAPATAPEPGPREIALALEVVAARWFTLGVPERP